MKNVAITGMGVISSLGQDVPTCCRNIEAGKGVAGPTPWGQPGDENLWMSGIPAFRRGPR